MAGLSNRWWKGQDNVVNFYQMTSDWKFPEGCNVPCGIQDSRLWGRSVSGVMGGWWVLAESFRGIQGWCMGVSWVNVCESSSTGWLELVISDACISLSWSWSVDSGSLQDNCNVRRWTAGLSVVSNASGMSWVSWCWSEIISKVNKYFLIFGSGAGPLTRAGFYQNSKYLLAKLQT